jgi:MYXO-CTERM domain-containing protein
MARLVAATFFGEGPMRKFLIRSAMVVALSAPVAVLSAQTASQPSDASGNGNGNAATYGSTTGRHDDAGKWGLLGLLGLAGLFGLKRADRTDRAENYRTNTAGGAVPTR